MNAAPKLGFDARRALTWGSIWGLAVSFCEFLAVSPIDAWGSVAQLLWILVYWMLPFWCAVGTVYIWWADRSARISVRLGPIAGFIAACLIFSAVGPPLSTYFWMLTREIFPSLDRVAVQLGISQPLRSNWGTLSLYYMWINLFYGTLLMAAWRLTVRAERIRHLMHQNAMARSRTEALLDAERLQALQSQIDPNFLLDAMQELEQRYRADPERAERLLEALVEFLRYAMHGLRAPISTVAAELKLARAFAQLQRERGVQGAWRVVDESAPDTSSHKFPSLLMLPLLALGGAGGRPLLRVRAQNGQTVLSLHGLAQGVSSELSQQIRARLYALYGEHFLCECPSTLQNQFAITLHPIQIHRGESYA